MMPDLPINETRSQPNILLIMADQLTPFLTGAYDHAIVQTPHLDRLVREGVRFDAAYSPCPLCVPARASFMTGRYPSRLGCMDNGDPFACEVPTFAHYLTNAGYDTVLSGKMHFIGPDQLHGFHTRLTTDVYPSSFDWSQYLLDERDQRKVIRWDDFHKDYQMDGVGPIAWTPELKYDEETHFRSLEYLREDHDRPFLLVTSYTNPHSPFIPPKRFWEMYEDVEIDLPDYPDGMEATCSAMDRWLNEWHGVDRYDIRSPEHLRAVRRGYYALVSYIDEKVGELLAVLEEQGDLSNTIVIFTADHGDMLGEKGMIQKRYFYEWSVRIPLIICYLDQSTAGTTVHAPVSLMDLMPTLLDLGGVNEEDRTQIDGRSLIPLIEGEERLERVVVSEYHVEGVLLPCFMARCGRYKYIYIHGEASQLFDLVTDPGEWQNLAGQSGFAEIETSLREDILSLFDPDAIQAHVIQALKQKHIVKQTMRLNATHWDYQPQFNADKQYVR